MAVLLSPITIHCIQWLQRSIRLMDFVILRVMRNKSLFKKILLRVRCCHDILSTVIVALENIYKTLEKY